MLSEKRTAWTESAYLILFYSHYIIFLVNFYSKVNYFYFFSCKRLDDTIILCKKF